MAEQSFDALRVLEAAKDLERSGQAFYQEAAESVSDQSVRKMLLALAEAEARHLNLIDDMQRGLEGAFPTLSHEKDVKDLSTRFREALFPEAPSSILSDTSKLTEIKVLERGIRLEEDSIRLYEGAAEKETNPGASNAFRSLVMEERIHLFMLNRRRDVLKMQGQGA